MRATGSPGSGVQGGADELLHDDTLLTPVLGPAERAIYRQAGIDPAADQRWTGYAVSLLLFNVVGMLLSLLVFWTQQWLPWNDQGFGPVPALLAINTAVSLATNTNWQAYSGESTMSNLAQMVGLAVHTFTSAATGMAVAVALSRGLARRSARGIGNSRTDVVRSTLYPDPHAPSGVGAARPPAGLTRRRAWCARRYR